MVSYVVLSGAEAKNSADAAAEQVVFVPDAFSRAALLFAPLVLLRHRLWLAALAYGLAAALLTVCAVRFALPWPVVLVVLAGLHVLVALELPALRLFKLARLGAEELAVVVAPDRAAAERRFFEAWTPARPAAAPARRAAMPTAGTSTGAPASSAVIGSFPERGAS